MATYNIPWGIHTLEAYKEIEIDTVALVGQVNVGDTLYAITNASDNDTLVDDSYQTWNITVTPPVDKATQDSTGISATIDIDGPGPFTGATIQITTSGSKNTNTARRFVPFRGWARGTTHTFTASSYSVAEGSTINVSVSSTDTSSFNLYWDVPGVNIGLSPSSGTIAMSGGTGSFSLTAVSDEVVEGNSTENLLLRIKDASDVYQDVVPFSIGDNSHGDYGFSVLNAQGYPIFSTDGEIPYKNLNFISGTILADTEINIPITGYDPSDASWVVLVNIGSDSQYMVSHLDPIRVYHETGNIRMRNDTVDDVEYIEGNPVFYEGQPRDVNYSIVVGRL